MVPMKPTPGCHALEDVDRSGGEDVLVSGLSLSLGTIASLQHTGDPLEPGLHRRPCCAATGRVGRRLHGNADQADEPSAGPDVEASAASWGRIGVPCRGRPLSVEDGFERVPDTYPSEGGGGMCANCGCGIPEDTHGDDRNILWSQIAHSANAARITPQQAAQNIQAMAEQKAPQVEQDLDAEEEGRIRGEVD